MNLLHLLHINFNSSLITPYRSVTKDTNLRAIFAMKKLDNLRANTISYFDEHIQNSDRRFYVHDEISKIS